MSEDAAFTADEVQRLRELLEIDAIKKTKLLYSQFMDSRDVDALAEIFAEDAVCNFGPYGTWTSRKEIHEGYKAVFSPGGAGGSVEPYGGFHVTTNQWVELTSPTTAVSRTYLIDTVHEPDPRTNPIIWLGLYDEEYKKVDGVWQIKLCTLQYLWPQRIITGDWPGPFPPKD